MNIGDWIQLTITILLVGITGWYAWETRRIVRNMERDREEIHRPLLILQLISWEAHLLKLRIQNVGGGGAIGIEGKLESKNKEGSNVVSWSYPVLCSNQFEEFGFPVPEGGSKKDQFELESIKDRVVEIKADFIYKSTYGINYELKDSIPIQKVTQDWIESHMLATQDHPERIMPRIAKTLEKIEISLRNINKD
jgi:hypothetical protein